MFEGKQQVGVEIWMKEECKGYQIYFIHRGNSGGPSLDWLVTQNSNLPEQR